MPSSARPPHRAAWLAGLVLSGLGCARDYEELVLAPPATEASSSTSVSTGAGGDRAAGGGGVVASGGRGGAGASGGGASAGASTGGASPCGNGVIDEGEQCDVGGDDAFCQGCSIVCNPPDAQDPSTGKCYRFEPGLYDWFDSQTKCAAWRPGADLAAVESAAENAFLIGIIDDHAFIGGRDESGNDTFFWVTGAPVAPDFAPWGIGQPNQGFEDCIALHGADGPFTWHDVKCMDGSVWHYLCEWPLH